MTRDCSRFLTILYGSETGTAQEVSENIWRESKCHHFRGKVMSMNEYNAKNLIDEKLVIFVVSTTGQGDEPSNMKLFWKFLLRRNLPANSLSSLQFSVIGLGDSSYQKYNFVSKRLYKRLLQLGASSILPLCLCDDQHDLGIAGALYPWLTDFWSKNNEINPLPLGVHVLPKSFKKVRWTVDRIQDHYEQVVDIYSDFEETCDEAYAQVVRNDRTTSLDHFQDVRLISFDSGDLKWEIGDVAYIRPRNSKESVDKLFEIFKEHNLDFGDKTCVLLEDDEEILAPDVLKKPKSLRDIATQFWDLSARPKPRAFEVLSYNCENELERDKLIELGSFAEGQEDWLNYVNRPRRNILEVLQDFHHATSKLSLELLFELFQPIRQRAFSIASSQLSNKLDLLVAVVEYYTNLKSQRKGLCSNWMKELKIGDRVRISIKKGTFKFPRQLDIPFIMVGPGTGLAPFRAVIQDIDLKGESCTRKLNLFFGCRYADKDFHCRDELKKLENEGKLTLFCAFSRDQGDKIYVQNLISKEKSLLRDLIINKGGYFYISGNSKNMPNAVKEALQEALEDKSYVEKMLTTGRYQEETWA